MESMWRSVPRLYYAARKYLFHRAKECGMEKGQPRILDYVYLNDGCIQREVGEVYSLKAPTVAGFLTVLEKEGLLKRIRKPDSPRQVNVYITEDGLKMQEKLNVVYDEIDEIGFQDFTQEEKEKCLGYLSRMAENMMSYLKKHPLGKC